MIIYKFYVFGFKFKSKMAVAVEEIYKKNVLKIIFPDSTELFILKLLTILFRSYSFSFLPKTKLFVFPIFSVVR